MPNPKRHHKVPRFYLDQWKDPCSEKSTIWIFNKDSLDCSPRLTKDTFVEGHYFTEQELDGTRHAPLENYLNRNETIAATLLRRLEANDPLTEYDGETPLPAADRNVLRQFIAGLFVRSAWWRELLPHVISYANAKTNQEVKSRTQRELEQDLRQQGFNRTDRRKALRENKKKQPSINSSLQELTASWITKVHPQFIINASNQLELAKTLPFTIVRVEGLPLLTSDTPCIIEEDPSIFQLHREKILGSAFICPLTPHLAFVGALGLKDEYATFDSDWSRLFNARIRANAQKELIANTKDVDETWFLNNQNSPRTMQEILEPSRRRLSLGTKVKKKGFGRK